MPGSFQEAADARKLKKTSKRKIAGDTAHELETDPLLLKKAKKAAKFAAALAEADEQHPEKVEADPAEAKKLKKIARQAAAAGAEAQTEKEFVEADEAEAKRQRKAARRAERHASLAEETPIKIESAEEKRQRKAARRAARDAALAEETPIEIDSAEEKRRRKAAKRAAAAAASTEDGTASRIEGSDALELCSSSKGDANCTEDGLTIFVGGIPFSCDEETLYQDFAVCGEIEHLKMPKNTDGRPSGTAFITFKSKQGVVEALGYDGDNYFDRRLTVKIAGNVGQRGHARGDANLEICVKGLTNRNTDAEVREKFSVCGAIQSFRMPRWPDGGAKGMAFITFQTTAGLESSLKLDGIEWGNWYLSVQKAVQGKGGKGKIG